MKTQLLWTKNVFSLILVTLSIWACLITFIICVGNIFLLIKHSENFRLIYFSYFFISVIAFITSFHYYRLKTYEN
jgi:hypothetical protein